MYIGQTFSASRGWVWLFPSIMFSGIFVVFPEIRHIKKIHIIIIIIIMESTSTN